MTLKILLQQIFHFSFLEKNDFLHGLCLSEWKRGGAGVEGHDSTFVHIICEIVRLSFFLLPSQIPKSIKK
jgi:hypothetical protein